MYSTYSYINHYSCFSSDSQILGQSSLNIYQKYLKEESIWGDILFEAALSSNSKYVEKEEFDRIYKNSGSGNVGDIDYVFGVNIFSKPKIKVECINKNIAVSTSKLRVCPIALKLEIKSKIAVVNSGSFASLRNASGAIELYYFTREYIRSHEFGHSDFVWGEFVVPLFYIVNIFNYKDINTQGFMALGNRPFYFDASRSCDDLKQQIETQWEHVWYIISSNDADHDKWDFYGRGTLPGGSY